MQYKDLEVGYNQFSFIMGKVGNAFGLAALALAIFGGF